MVLRKPPLCAEYYWMLGMHAEAIVAAFQEFAFCLVFVPFSCKKKVILEKKSLNKIFN